MCKNCLSQDSCDCPAGSPLVHCGCDPYYEEFCENCGHQPWTKGKVMAESGSKRLRR